MMPWLLKHEGYPSGFVAAILLHALLIYLVMPRDFSPSNLVKIEQPTYISATVTKDNPQRVRQLQDLERQRQQEQARERERRREEARAAEERQKREQAQLAAKQEADRKLAAEAQAQKQREQAAAQEKEQQARAAKEAEEKQAAARREAERQKQEQAAREAAEREAASQAAAQAQALSAENQLIAQYTAIIHDIVSSYWIQPPSSRNGMQVLINIKLTPTGEIISNVIVQSSGDAIFDRSALQAVEKAGRFPELRDLPLAVFERNFRNFNLLFSPEDLLR